MNSGTCEWYRPNGLGLKLGQGCFQILRIAAITNYQMICLIPANVGGWEGGHDTAYLIRSLAVSATREGLLGGPHVEAISLSFFGRSCGPEVARCVLRLLHAIVKPL